MPYIRNRISSLALTCLLSAVPTRALSPVWDHLWNYEDDAGAVFGQRTGGHSYGWNRDKQTDAVDRNHKLSLDERYDRSISLNDGDKWEMDVPNQAYRVLVVAGDPTVTDADYKIDVEGARAVDGKPSTAYPWVSGMVEVMVKDGKLTLTAGEGARNVRLAFAHVTSSFYPKFDAPQFPKFPLLVNIGGGAVRGFEAEGGWSENAPHGYYSAYPTDSRLKAYGETVEGSSIPEIFQSQRQGEYGYRVRVAPGKYFLALLFAEFENANSNKRRVGVTVNGQAFNGPYIDIPIAAKGLRKPLLVGGWVEAPSGFVEVVVTQKATFYPLPPTLAGLALDTKVITSLQDLPVSLDTKPAAWQMAKPDLRMRAGRLELSNGLPGDGLEIRTLQGRLVQRYRLNPDQLEVQLKPLPAGVHLVSWVRGGRELARFRLAPVGF